MKTIRMTLLLVTLSISGYGNTAFQINTTKTFLAKNHDSQSSHGMLIQNLRGQKKTAYGFHTGRQASWISKYGSLTINQLGKEFPIGGINEAGLAVEHLFLGTSEYPESPAPILSELEWIQYQLDNFGSVDEVLANIERLRIRPLQTSHFMIADSSGRSAVIDFIGGNAEIYDQKEPYQVMTQTAFRAAYSYHLEEQAHGRRSGNEAIDKYVLLMGHLKNSPEVDIQTCFDLLDISANRSGNQKTQWHIVYDLKDRCIFLGHAGLSRIRQVCLSDFDFSQEGESLASPIQTKSFHWEEMDEKTHGNLLALAMKYEQITLDERALVAHMIDPSEPIIDSVYMHNHVDVVIKFVTNRPTGIVSYIFKPNRSRNNPGLGIISGQFLVEKKETVRVIYNLPKAPLELACFQDPEYAGAAENKLDAGTSGFSFLRTGGYHQSGTMPRYVDVKFDLRRDTDITVKIK